MALASISHLHPHRIQTPKDFSRRNTNPLRIPELIRDQARSRQHHPTLHCLAGIDTISSTQPAFTASACSYDTTKHIELLASIQDSVQRASSGYLHGLVLADLDPATAKLAITITGPFLSAFGFLFIIRIVMSWYPKLPVGKFPYVVAYAPTEPILNLTRKVIPPLGGVDVTPVVWFGLTSFLSEILVGPQGLLVLLSQQR